MPYKRERKPHSIFDYQQDDPSEDDLVKITLSNGEVIFVRRGIWKKHWALDPDLMPLRLSVQLRSLEGVALKVKVCTVGKPLVIKAVGLPSYLFCVLTSAGTVTRLRPASRPARFTPGTFECILSSC